MGYKTNNEWTRWTKIYDQKLMADTVRKLAWEGLQKNFVMDGDTMIDKRTCEVLDCEIDSTY